MNVIFENGIDLEKNSWTCNEHSPIENRWNIAKYQSGKSKIETDQWKIQYAYLIVWIKKYIWIPVSYNNILKLNT